MATLRVPVGPQDHIQGPGKPSVILLEYGDYQCPNCAAAQPVVKRVQRYFNDQLGYVYRHFPLTQIHPMAGPAAESAEYAGAHGLFWEMHDGLFANQPRLDMQLLLALTDELGLSPDDLGEALEAGTYMAKVQEDFLGGVRSGVNGTPTFFVNGRRLDAPPDFRTLGAAIGSFVNA